MHREFVGYFGIQGRHDTTQNKITLARPMLEPIASGTKYYLTEQNNILDPIGFIAIYGLKSVLGYYFKIPEITAEGIYYADYLGHTGYNYYGGRFETENLIAYKLYYDDKITYNEDLGVICEIPPAISDWISYYFESVLIADPTLPNTGTDLLPFYCCSQYPNEPDNLELYYVDDHVDHSTQIRHLYTNLSSDFAETLSFTNITSMRLQIQAEQVNNIPTNLGLNLSALEVNGKLYAFNKDVIQFRVGLTPKVIMLINNNTAYLTKENLDIWPSFE